MKYFNKIVNFILFALLWPAAVLGAVHNNLTWAIITWLGLLIHCILTTDNQYRLALFITLTTLFGFLFEAAIHLLGLVSYHGNLMTLNVPLWILLLWSGLGMSFELSHRWLLVGKRLYLLVWLMLVPLSYFTAANIGAIEVNYYLQSFLVIAVAWGTLIMSLRLMLQTLMVNQLTSLKMEDG